MKSTGFFSLYGGICVSRGHWLGIVAANLVIMGNGEGIVPVQLFDSYQISVGY